MPDEEVNLQKGRPDEKPPGFGLTIVAKPKEMTSSEEPLIKIRSAWSVVASWGRWCDEELGDWPAVEDCLAQLPPWLKSELAAVPRFEVENWLNDLHDRAWIWWSSTNIRDSIKIDVDADSMPVSLCPLVLLVEKGGGVVVYQDLWIGSDQLSSVL